MSIRKEIERSWRLSGLPSLPRGVVRIHLEQIYSRDGLRWRQITHQDGKVELEVIKKIFQGSGGEATEYQYDRKLEEWPPNQASMPIIRKWRWIFKDSSLEYHIDHLYEQQIYLLDVEIPSLDFHINFPNWLLPVLEEEVTGNVSWSNHNLAINGPPH